MRLAIFGGSFDPVHTAHESIVYEAINVLDIDKIIVVPTYLSPFKSSFLIEPATRFNLLKKVFNKNEQIEICDFEIKQNRSVCTIETVNYLKNLYNPSKIYVIIGADNIKSLNKWHKIDELKELVEFVIVSRNGFESNKLKEFKVLNLDINISSSKLRKEIDLSYIPIQIKEDLKNLNKTNKGKFLSNRLDVIKKILDEKKAENIEIIDLTNKEYIVDYVVIATTLNPKHGFALLNYLKTELKPLGEEFLRVDEDDEWTICDLGDMFINLMSPAAREKYSLEDFLNELEEK